MEQSSYAVVVSNMIAVGETYCFNRGRPMNSPMPFGLLRLSTLSAVSLLVSSWIQIYKQESKRWIQKHKS
jgi:hypothetical protein